MLFQADHSAQQSFLHEISMLKFASRDRNVVQFYGVSLQNGIWLITEHMEVSTQPVSSMENSARDLSSPLLFQSYVVLPDRLLG